jgi:hypothetical protein
VTFPVPYGNNVREFTFPKYSLPSEYDILVRPFGKSEKITVVL